MPRETGLLNRAGRWYFNVRVPTALRSQYPGEFIREALGTSDYRKAVSEKQYVSFRVHEEFAAKMRELEESNKLLPAAAPVLKMDDREAHQIVARFFIGLEKDTQESWDEHGMNLTGEDREEALENLQFESAAYAGTNSNVAPADADGHQHLNAFIEDEGLNIPKDSPAYRKLRSLFREALLENALRRLDRVKDEPVKAHRPLFRDAFSHTSTPPLRQRTTIGQMLSRYREWLSQSGKTSGTHRTYDLPARLLCEAFGKNKALDSITKDDVERLFTLLRRVPTNATKRYRGMGLAQAIEAADRVGDSQRLGAKTLKNYFNNISAIFNFGVEKKLMAENPAKDRYLRATFASERKESRKALFSADELNRLFKAPLYSGCKDDELGFAIPGPLKPRRGRFWVPLLALFHGLRLNEAAQLYTEDVRDENGIPYFWIREEREDKSQCDKKLKTKQSKRRVPIHPEMIAIGFLDYVAERRRDSGQPRLFPDLPRAKSTGYISDPFSKWFGRFVKSTLGAQCKATFHSFRHHFRDALREAGVSIDDAERLGGWSEGRRSAERDYGDGQSVKRLREQIAKVKYEGLDISHLHKKPGQPVASKARNCRARTRRR
jgi:integrase